MTEREMDAVFIDVEIDDDIKGDPELAKRLEEACPVDIYAAGENGVEVVRKNLDECVLCELCLDVAPDGKLAVLKLYDGTELRR